MSDFTMLMAESALRVAALAGLAGLLLAALRVRDAAVRSAVWSAVVAASLLMPLAVWLVPPVFLREAAPASRPVTFALGPGVEPAGPGVDWPLALYLAGATLGILRIVAAMAWGWRLRRRSQRVEIAGPVEVRESDAIGVPMTFGWLRPFVMLPGTWRTWEPRKLDAVLLHEGAHIARGDFLVHTLAAFQCALYWFSPLAWWLPRKLASLAELASDDRVLLEMGDRAYYAEVLFSFLGKRRLAALAVPMARSGSAAAGRIDRVLEEGRRLSRGTGAASRAAIAFFAAVALYVTSACSLAQAPPPPPPPPPPPAAETAQPAPPTPPAPPAKPSSRSRWRYRHNGDSESIDMNDARIDYERNGRRYRITDLAIIAEVKRLYATVEFLGGQQAELGAKQAVLGEQQAALGHKQANVAVDPGELHATLAAQMDKIRAKAAKKSLTQDELGGMQAELADLQAKLGELQARAGNSQAFLGGEQAKLGAQQAVLGDQQARLGQKQAAASATADAAMRKLIEQAIKDGLAKLIE